MPDVTLTPLMISDYDEARWSKCIIDAPEKIPTLAHYAAVLFSSREEWNEGAAKEAPYVSTLNETTYFCFFVKQDLEEWVAQALHAGKKFFFFHVLKLGEASVKVNIPGGLDV